MLKPFIGRKNSLFNKWYWENWIATCKLMKLESYLILNAKNNSEWIKDLSIRTNTIKLLEENLGINFCDFGYGTSFLDMMTKA